MKSFLLNNYLYLIFAFEILAAVTGLILFKKFKQTAAKYFIYFLWYVIFIVVAGQYTSLVTDNGLLNRFYGTYIERNYWWFTITWSILSILFFSFYFQQIFQQNIYKIFLKYATYLFLIICVFKIAFNFELFFKTQFSLINIAGSIIILFCVFFYFLEILNSNKILKFYKSITFYISCAVLVFWIIKTPLVFFELYFKKVDIGYVELKSLINLFVIAFMYTTFTIGLIVSKPEK